MRGYLSVRVVDSAGHDLHVADQCKGLRFKKAAVGGNISAQGTLNLPRGVFRRLGPSGRVIIYDRSGGRVWDGYPSNPGYTAGTEGESWAFQAVGGITLASDKSTKVVFIERALTDDVWVRRDLTAQGGITDVIANDLHLQFPAGIPVNAGTEVGMEYTGLYNTGQDLLVFESQIRAGKADAGYTQVADALTNGTYQSIAIPGVGFATGTTTVSATRGTSFSTGINGIMVLTHRAGAATNVNDDTTYGRWIGPYLRGVVKGKDGTEDPSGPAYQMTANQIAAHVVGALLPWCDGANAQIDTASYGITHLTYHDGATPEQILTDLALYEPDFYWGIGCADATGKHTFWFRAWPTTPRYEISTDDGFAQPGGDVDLCNSIIVYWTDPIGAKQSTRVTADVPELGGDPAAGGFAGRERMADAVTLPDGQGSSENASRVGAQVLAAKNQPPQAATAVVRHPIVDLWTGETVMPWEIEPGFPVRVRESGEVLRLTEMEYVDDDAASTLTLGTPQLTTEQIVARLSSGRAA